MGQHSLEAAVERNLEGVEEHTQAAREKHAAGLADAQTHQWGQENVPDADRCAQGRRTAPAVKVDVDQARGRGGGGMAAAEALGCSGGAAHLSVTQEPPCVWLWVAREVQAI